MASPRAALIRAILATLFPARCLGCGKRGHAICPACAATLQPLPESVCARCALPLPASAPCRACRHIHPALASVRAVYPYEGIPRKAVHTLKFRHGRYLAEQMGAALRAALATRPLRADLLVPAPLAPVRLHERGYNQSELLARQVASSVGVHVAPHLLARHHRPPQQSLRAAERRQNLRGAVWCPDPTAVAGRRILLLDDVLTTGATLGECALVLQAAGATWVGALVYARDL